MEMTVNFMKSVEKSVSVRMQNITRQIKDIDRLEPDADCEAIYIKLAELSRNIELLSREMRSELLELHAGLESLGLFHEYQGLFPCTPGISEITERNGVFHIRMDGMLPFAGNGLVYYLHEQLDAAIKKYRDENALSAPIFKERCAVVILHHYDTRIIKRRYIRDYDNLERRCVLNVIALHFLTDDNPAGYIAMDDIVPDNQNYTEICVMNIPSFQNYVMSEKLTMKM